MGPVTIQEATFAPEADFSSVPGGIINIREGGQVKLHIPVFGKPSPSVTWSRERIPLKRMLTIIP